MNSAPKKEKARDVDTYIAGATDEAIPLLEEIRGIIKAVVPDVEENISWRVPFFKYYGGLAGVAAYKNHIGFGVAMGRLDPEYREALEKKGYTTGLKTFQIKFDKPVPVAILKKILKAKAIENKSRKKAK